MSDLTDHERAMLDFEARWYRHGGAKDSEITETFQVSATRYYQVLNALVETPAALAYSPVVVGRLRRLRDARTVQRRARRRDGYMD